MHFAFAAALVHLVLQLQAETTQLEGADTSKMKEMRTNMWQVAYSLPLPRLDSPRFYEPIKYLDERTKGHVAQAGCACHVYRTSHVTKSLQMHTSPRLHKEFG